MKSSVRESEKADGTRESKRQTYSTVLRFRNIIFNESRKVAMPLAIAFSDNDDILWDRRAAPHQDNKLLLKRKCTNGDRMMTPRDQTLPRAAGAPVA